MMIAALLHHLREIVMRPTLALAAISSILIALKPLSSTRSAADFKIA
jgi:hypothetical protein